MPIKLLIIAHLLADFIFQPTKLIEWKKKNFFGILVHVTIFALLSLILLSSYLNHWETWVVILVISVVHFFTDKIKIAETSKNTNYTVPFLLDQGVHLAALLIGVQFIPKIGVEIGNVVIFAVLIAIYFIYIFFIYFLQKSTSKKLVHSKVIAFTVAYIVYFVVALIA